MSLTSDVVNYNSGTDTLVVEGNIDVKSSAIVESNLYLTKDTSFMSISGTALTTPLSPGTLITNGGIRVSKNINIGSDYGGVVYAKNATALNVASMTFTDTSAGTTQSNNTFAVQQPTLAASQTKTTTVASAAFVGGAPIKGANNTITNDYGLYIAAGSATGATVTEAASMYIDGPPSVTSGSTYAMKVNSGISLFSGSTSSSSVSTGSLVVSGGVGIGGNLNVGGTITGTIAGNVTNGYSVKAFGAVGDGVADDTAAIQAAFDSAYSYILFPQGTYKVTSRINITRGSITIHGENAIVVKDDSVGESVFKFNGGASFKGTGISGPLALGANSITITDSTGVQEGDWILITSGENWYHSSSWYPKSNLVEVESVSGNTLTLHTPILVPITSPTGASFFRPIRYINIDGIEFRSSTTIPSTPASEGPIGLELLNTADVRVTNCTFKYFLNKAIDTQYSFRVDCLNNKFFGVPDGFVMTYPLSGDLGYYGHVTGTSYGINTINCYAYRIRHLSDGARTVNHRTSNCSSVSHHRSMIRLHSQNINAIATDNWGYSTIGSGLLNTGTPFKLIANNHFIMLGTDIDAAIISDNPSNSGAPSDAYLSLRYPCTVSNNIFETSPDNVTSSMVFGSYYSELIVSGNIFKNCTNGIVIRSLYINNCLITGNTFDCLSIVSNDAILFEDNSLNYLRDNIVIENNVMGGYLRSGIRFHAPTTPSSRTNVLKIRNNVMDAVNSVNPYPGVFIDSGYFGSNIEIIDNVVRNAPSGGQTLIITDRLKFERMPYVKYLYTGNNKGRYATNIVGYESTSTLSTGTTIEPLSVVMNTSIQVGNPIGWVCGTGGTVGTLSGVTANTNGTTTVTLIGNSATKVNQGNWIIVNGSPARVISLSDDFATATVTGNIAAATGVAVSYRNPTLIEFGRIGNKTGTYSAYASATNQRTATTDVSAVTLAEVASKLTNLISDLQSSGVIG